MRRPVRETPVPAPRPEPTPCADSPSSACPAGAPSPRDSGRGAGGRLLRPLAVPGATAPSGCVVHGLSRPARPTPRRSGPAVIVFSAAVAPAVTAG